MVRELNLYFARLRREDEHLTFDMLNNVLTEEKIDKLCFVRGIDINQDIKDKIKDLKLWLSISNQRNVPHSLLMYIRVHEFNQDQFEISDDEDEAEVLRRVSQTPIANLFVNFSPNKTPTTWRRCESSKRLSAWMNCSPPLTRCTPSSR